MVSEIIDHFQSLLIILNHYWPASMVVAHYQMSINDLDIGIDYNIDIDVGQNIDMDIGYTIDIYIYKLYYNHPDELYKFRWPEARLISESNGL